MEEKNASEIIARLDRLPVWSLPATFIAVLGTGFLFTFFDIFDINVSFIQTALTTFGVTSPSSPKIPQLLGPVVLWNLVGYVIGALALTPLADRYGRKRMLMVTMAITGLGSLYNALSPDYLNYLLARTITGIGVGADLAIVNTYINEVSPVNGRAKFTSLVFLFATLGAFLGLWLGLLITTPPAPFPLGLPVALGNTGVFATSGWRIMYGIGSLLAVIGLLLRVELPESPRWLVSKGRIVEASRIVERMEEIARRKMGELPPIPQHIEVKTITEVSYREALKTILGNRVYLKRWVIIMSMWFFGYITVYTNAAGLTTILSSLGYPSSEAGMIASLGILGFVAVPVLLILFGDRLERKVWVPISAIIMLLGGIIMAEAGRNFPLEVLGALVLFFGNNLWVPISYTWTTENFPTRARVTGFGLADGIGHIGGGIGSFLVALEIGNIVSRGVTGNVPLEVFMLMISFQLVSALISLAGIRTARKRLDEISPH
ncbi:MFS transporter [Metallosphaera javensis (ex Sakai et al. 2022)]|uniref:MFS transporter n=1 Tax=Metallosphaera javensis (ex Sakai et al. 2022) TaxID=2775498 RepID=UPI00258BC199|nr:MAG: putative sialic acid transporter [Metallosphaera javensis (ex Sakai et al. 2022)]